MFDEVKKNKSRLKTADTNVVALDTNSNVLWNGDYTDSLDLTPYIQGVAEKPNQRYKYAPFEGQPRFISEIKSALERVVENAKSTGDQCVYLNSFFKFLSVTNRIDFSIDQLSSELLSEHRNFLERKYKLSSRSIAQYQTAGNSLLRELHAEHVRKYPNLSTRNNAPILYPIAKASSNKATKDISPFANRYIYDYCKAYLNDIDQNPYANIPIVQGTDPYNLSHQLYAVNDIIQRTLHGEPYKKSERVSKDFWLENYGFERRPFNGDSTFLTGNIKPLKVIETLYPSSSEAAATAFMISYETAWIDTALNLNISSKDWYHTDADDPKNPRASDGVTLYARRPKTDTSNEEPKAQLSSGRHGSAFSVIKRMITRTERLRNHVKQELKSNTLSKPERVELEAALRNPIILLGKKEWKARVPIAKDVQHFLDDIKTHAESDPSLTAEQVAEIKGFTWKDTRDAEILSGFDRGGIFEAQRVAGHKSVTTTFEYLKDRKFKSELFAKFSNASGIIYDEVSNGYAVDKNIIRARVLKEDDLTEDERAKLSGITASGARCKDIENPPSEIGNLGKGACQQQSCVLCPNAVFIPQEKRALKAFALRFTEVTFKANNLAHERFENSVLEAELVALEKYKTEFFSDRLDEFEEIFEQHLERLKLVNEVA